MSHSQFQSKGFILRLAWLSLWDERMTTGRINQVAFFPSSASTWIHHQMIWLAFTQLHNSKVQKYTPRRQFRHSTLPSYLVIVAKTTQNSPDSPLQPKSQQWSGAKVQQGQLSVASLVRVRGQNPLKTHFTDSVRALHNKISANSAPNPCKNHRIWRIYRLIL